MSGPADEARLGEFLKAIAIRHAFLLRIRGNNLKVAAWAEFFAGRLAEREESVARPTPGVNASEHGAHADAFLHEVDALIEIAATEEDVI
jgi:hypothetical protein